MGLLPSSMLRNNWSLTVNRLNFNVIVINFVYRSTFCAHLVTTKYMGGDGFFIHLSGLSWESKLYVILLDQVRKLSIYTEPILSLPF